MALRNRRLAELALFAALATLHTWPLATNPAHLTRLDNDDTAFNTWVIAWVAHQIPRNPLALFEAPIFHPAPDALAFSEHMVVQSLIGAPLQWAGVSPVLVYNLLVWVGLTLSGYAMARLLQRWTGSTAAGLVGGALFSFNALTMTRFAHLQALHLEFLPIALYALDRVLVDGRRRDGVWLAFAFVLQALCSNYTMVMMTLAFAVGALVRPEPWGANARRVWTTLALAAAIAIIALVPFLLPYYRVRTTQGLVRTVDDVRLYSAGWADYLVTAANVHYRTWSHLFFEGRTSLFPGVTAVALSLVAIASGRAWRDRRARMALAFGLAGFALSFGAALPGYVWMHEHVPLLQGIRAAARWGTLLLIAVAMLAAYGVAALQTRFGARSWWTAAVIGLLGLVTVEALRAPLQLTPFGHIPRVHARLADPAVEAIVVFPLYPGAQFNRNSPYLLDQTRHWKPMINGYSSFAPASFYERAERLQAFPAQAAIDELRAIGVTHVVLHRAPLERAFGAAALTTLRGHPALEFLVEDEGVILYRLR